MTRSLAESLGAAGADPRPLAVAWARDFLTAAQLPITPATLQAVYSWQFAESAGGGGMWNPLNTTQGGYAGESNFNSVGVKNYRDRGDGLAANAHVIHNGFYPGVLSAMTSGAPAAGITEAITASPWGTGRIVLMDPPGPSPAPPPPVEVLEVQVIALPQHGTPAGRVALAMWDPAHPNRVALVNGARLKGDKPVITDVHVWSPRNKDGASEIPAGVIGVGISAQHGGLRGQITAVVLACEHGLTYVAELP